MRTIYSWFIFLIAATYLYADTSETKGLGLKSYSQAEIADIELNTDEIIHVRPNKVGKQRIDRYHQSRGLLLSSETPAISTDEEFVTRKGLTRDIISNDAPLRATSLPRSVNNSTLPSFPPIGDQKSLGSCVAWASTYYQASHEIGLLNGYNNKSSNVKILSPKWTYNTLNQGEDGGLYVMDAYTLLNVNGAPSIASFPYDNNYLQWDTNQQDWVSAISNRLDKPQIISGIGGATQNLQTIKEILNNGHVVTFATYVNSWVYGTVGRDPNSASNPHAGEKAVLYMNGYIGGHCITIVGYDDDIWIDINKNGVVDAGEKGAFLIANSWGTSWGNNGFIWVSYDAFLAQSAVVNGPSRGRIALADAMNSNVVCAIPKAANYKPSMIAQFSLSQSIRNQISVGAGISTTAANTPQKSITSCALNYQGGSYEFNGTRPTTPQTANFALDLTDLIAQANLSTPQRFYFLLSDSTASNPTVLNSLTLLDYANNKQVSYGNVPLNVDKSKATLYIDYSSNDTPNPPTPPPTPDTIAPTVSITSPINGTTLKGIVQVTANARDGTGISKVEFYIDSVLKFTDTSAPYLYSLDTTSLSNGTHTLKAVAYDTSNNSAQSSISVNVQNSSYPRSYFVNCGGSAVSNSGITWRKDQYYTGGNVASTTSAYANPIYKTERWGNFSYTFPVENGNYYVTLKFAEFYFKAINQRVFNVAINGARVINALDLYKVAKTSPYDLSFPVTVTNNRIKIDFSAAKDYAKISGIQISQR